MKVKAKCAWALFFKASQINGFVLKDKKKHILLDSVETNLNIWRVQDKSETIENVSRPDSSTTALTIQGV